MDLSLQKSVIFQNAVVPNGTTLAGMSALVQTFQILAPVRYPACISQQHIKGHIKKQENWHIYSKRYEVAPTIEAHLNFAMRYEYVDLLVLKRIFLALPPEALTKYIGSAPNSIFTRRAWYFYELLTGKKLKLPDAGNVTAVDLLDSEKYFTQPQGVLSRRHKVRDNLLGTVNFCPIIRKTEALTYFTKRNLSRSALKTIGRVNKAIIARAASFLLLADSRATFLIEGERPPRNRIEKWGRAVMQSGKYPLTIEELVRLQGIIIEDNRFIQPGLRTHGVFLGEHTADGYPLPQFVGARPDDLEEFITALIDTNAIMASSSLDAVIQAAAIAFGFVYVHPFADGNGRLHRYLIHHILANRQFTPPDMLFSVSSVMLDWIDLYRETLQAHSRPLMDFIEWVSTPKGNVKVTNDTADLYRYFDCTEAAEFLYRCVERTIDVDLPHKIDFITRRDDAMREVMNFVEMPDRMAEQFVLYVYRNNGSLPNRRRKEFAALTENELEKLEKIVKEAFADFKSGSPE